MTTEGWVRRLMTGINLNLLECKYETRSKNGRAENGINLNLLECKYCDG